MLVRGAIRLLPYLNTILARVNLKVEQVRPTNWDRTFSRWVRDAERRGLDPNDLGDDEWGADLLEDALERFYRPLLGPSKAILELGPGSGRLTRHLAGNCAKLILVDTSPVVLKWLNRYLNDRGNVELLRAEHGQMPGVASATVDAVIAHGVVEHLEQEELFDLLLESSRVLRLPGHVAFNFDDLSSGEGLQVLREQAGKPREAGRFRLHHPESIRALARAAGLEPVSLESTTTRIGFALLVKTAANQAGLSHHGR